MSDEGAKPATVMAAMPRRFQPDKAQGVNAVVQWVLTGADGGEWYTTIANGSCEVAEGRAAKPKVTITMDGQDYVDLSMGKLDGMKAFMSGKIKMAGDFMLASRLISFFRI